MDVSSPKSRLRWFNYLHPNIKRGTFSGDEEELIIRLHRLLGNRWSLIAKRLPGRTDNDVKNFWNTHLCKKLREKNETTYPPPTDYSSNTSKHVTDKVNVVSNGETEPCENQTATKTGGVILDNSSGIPCEVEEESYYETVQYLKSQELLSICSQQFTQHDLLQVESNSDINNLFYTDTISPLLSTDFSDCWRSL